MKFFRNKINLMMILIAILIGFGLGTNTIMKNTAEATTKTPTVAPQIKSTKVTSSTIYTEVSSLAVVANPARYLNKHIKIKAKFDKFSTLGLDYKPAFRSAEKYITFLIKRDDVIDHTIPLSEMKNFLPRKIAEKYIDLSAGDEIEYSGTVFSTALGDVWINVDKFKVLSQKTKKQK